MIELDIKIRAKDSDTVKLFTDIMMKGLAVANQMGQIDVSLSAEKDGDTITFIRKEILKGTALEKLKKNEFTLITEFLEKADLSMRSHRILIGMSGDVPFAFAEDITKEKFLKCKNAGNKSWEEVELELIRQKIKY